MRPRRLAVLLGSLALAACGAPAEESGAPGPKVRDAVWGRTFLLTEATTGGDPKALVDGTTVSLRFTEDGRLLADAGCNMIGGPAEVSDGRLSVEELSVTGMGCDPPRHAQDTWLTEFLDGEPSVRLADARLVLSGADTELVLTDRSVADPDRPLVGTEWTVDTLVDGDMASSTPAGAPAATLVFGQDLVEVTTGCNQGTASYEVSGRTIRFATLTLTRKGCPPDLMALESAVIDVLDGEVGFTVEADTLALEHPSGKGLRLRAE